MFALIETRTSDGRVQEVRLYENKQQAVADAIEEAEENGFVKEEDDKDYVRHALTDGNGYYTDGDVRITVVEAGRHG